MKIAVIIQARMTSTRLPGKVLLPLAGQPMLARQLERLRRLRHPHEVVLATTTNASDEPLVALCRMLGVHCFRGSEHDVLARYAGAAREVGAEVVVRITSDCPLLDPTVVDEVIDAYLAGGCDYASNMLEPRYPYGMAVEVFSAAALYQAEAQACQPAEREHVTPYLYWHPQRFALRSVRCAQDLSAHRWTVDTPEDYQLVQLIFETLYPRQPDFALADVLALLAQHPDWPRINQHVAQVKPRNTEEQAS